MRNNETKVRAAKTLFTKVHYFFDWKQIYIWELTLFFFGNILICYKKNHHLKCLYIELYKSGWGICSDIESNISKMKKTHTQKPTKQNINVPLYCSKPVHHQRHSNKFDLELTLCSYHFFYLSETSFYLILSHNLSTPTFTIFHIRIDDVLLFN